MTVQRWLLAHPRFVVHFTHTSVRALNADIRTWIKTWNESPRPYVWTKTAEQILESITKYCTRIKHSGHSPPHTRPLAVLTGDTRRWRLRYPARGRIVAVRGFDPAAMFAAIEQAKLERELSWTAVAEEMWAEAEALHASIDGHEHPIAVSTITHLRGGTDTSCQHALVMLRWLHRPPEDFVAETAPGTAGAEPR